MGAIRVLPIVALAVAAVLAQPASAEPRGKGQIKAVGKAHGALSAPGIGNSGRRDGTTIRAFRRNQGDDHRVVRIIDDFFSGTDGFHGLPPGLAKRHGNLPHGLAKRGHLPPGLAKGHGVPPGLANRSQLPPGLSK
jgi:hypothetical protein